LQAFSEFKNEVENTEISGNWVGVGYSVNSNGERNSCSELEFKIDLTSDLLKTDSSMIQCGDLIAILVPYQATILNGDLWYQNQKIGSLTSDAFQLRFIEKNSDIITEYKSERDSSGRLLYSIKMIKGEEFLKFEYLLAKTGFRRELK